MPETVPTVDLLNPNYVRVSFRYIDANNTKDAFSVTSTMARATAANIQAAIVALGVASNANIYEVDVAQVYAAGNATPTVAVEAPRESAKDVIETLHKDPTSLKTQYDYIPAPIDSMFIPGTQQVDVDNEDYEAVQAAFEALLPASFNAISVRFAEHKLTAQKTNL